MAYKSQHNTMVRLYDGPQIKWLSAIRIFRVVLDQNLVLAPHHP